MIYTTVMASTQMMYSTDRTSAQMMFLQLDINTDGVPTAGH